jgi:hypothetical protein
MPASTLRRSYYLGGMGDHPNSRKTEMRGTKLTIFLTKLYLAELHQAVAELEDTIML